MQPFKTARMSVTLKAMMLGFSNWSQPNKKQPTKAMIKAIGLVMQRLREKVTTGDIAMAIKKAIVKAIVRVVRLVGALHLHFYPHLYPVMLAA